MIELVLGAMCGLVTLLSLRSLITSDQRVLARLAPVNKSIRASRYGRRFDTRAIGRILRILGAVSGDVERIGQRLTEAGLGFEAQAFAGGRNALCIVAGLVGLRWGAFAIVVSPILVLLCYRAPDLLIGLRIKARHEEISRELPDAVDMLAVATQAGLNLSLALERVSSNTRGGLGAELTRTM
ncbi:MAG: hypothetical protein ABR507_05700, partial [Actinomycetota bacterium]